MTNTVEYASSAANRLAVASDRADRAYYAAMWACKAALKTLSQIPGGRALAANTALAARRLREGSFPALANYLAAKHHVAAAERRHHEAQIELVRYNLLRRLADEGPQNLHRWQSWPEGDAAVADAARHGWIATAKAEPWHHNSSLIVITDAGRAALSEIERGA